MNIKLDENFCGNLDQGIKTEWLQVNKLGTYSSSTIYGLNSRKEHGLFVVPTTNPQKKVNLLSKFEETVFVKDYSYELSANQYEKTIYPDGYKHLKGFTLNPFPTFQYLISDRRIEKSILLLHDANVLIVRYELKNNGDPVKLIIKPIIAARYADDLIKDIQGINPDSYMAENVVKIAARSDMPELNMSYPKGEYTPAALWYHNFYYNVSSKMENNSNLNKEDLLNPGFFTHTIEPYESFEIYISLVDWYGFDYEYILRKEKEYRLKINQTFINLPSYIKESIKEIETISVPWTIPNISCLPDFYNPQCDIRETLFAMKDALLLQKDDARINSYIDQCIQKLNNGLLYHGTDDGEMVKNIYADASLHLINLGYYTYKLFNNTEFLEKNMFDPFVEIIEQFRKGTDFNTYMDKDGLIFSGDRNINTGFIPGLVEQGQVLRYGKLLEINIFWLNALYIMRFFCEELKKSRLEKKFSKLIEQSSKNFIEVFWDESNNKFFDYIRNEKKDNTFRMNQIYALSVPFKIIDNDPGKQLINLIKDELLTDYGLRSLSKNDPDFIKSGDEKYLYSNRFNGAVHLSTIYDYITAVANFADLNSEGDDWRKRFTQYEDHFKRDCIGFLPELLVEDEIFQSAGNAASIRSMLAVINAVFYFFNFNNSDSENDTKEN